MRTHNYVKLLKLSDMLFAGTTRIGTREKDHLIVSHNLNFMRHKDNSKIQTSTMTVYLVTSLMPLHTFIA